MCGIVAVLYRRPQGRVPDFDGSLPRMDEAIGRLRESLARPRVDELASIAEQIEALDGELRGPLGTMALLAAPGLANVARLEERTMALEALVVDAERALDHGETAWGADSVEAGNAVIVRLKDAIWALGRDRASTASGIAGLVEDAAGLSVSAAAAYWSIQVALSALDRLEVRGRDSAGLHLLVSGHEIDLDRPEARTPIAARADGLFGSRAVHACGASLSFVYKIANEIGELGENTEALRAAIRDDALLHRVLAGPGVVVSALGHTRWASVGSISEANAHPLNSLEAAGAGADGDTYAVAAVNGDIDNHLELCAAEDLCLAQEITTDSKVLPTLVARRLAAGEPAADAFRGAVARCEGSAAMALNVAGTPDRLYLALRGSGQSLYVGLADCGFVVASEPYGVVQETARYLPMEGEGSGEEGAGQVVVLRREDAGTLGAIERIGYGGAPRPVTEGDICTAEITVRDIDRSGFPHFLLKEVSEAPQSFVKTLRGKIVENEEGLLEARLGADVLAPRILERLESGLIAKIRVIAQGTAAIAAQSVAASIGAALASLPVHVDAVLATEISGFGLVDDMSDTLIVVVSQSGTTTDTNRTVDLVRSRGAVVLAIVNRRNSDLVSKSDGVLYTSDGRDVEMSVASTKAFYAQVAAGHLLAFALMARLSCGDARRADRLLRALRALPEAMGEVLRQRPAIAAAASELAPSRRHWAVVGSGPNRVAAEEVRIKLSELCYHSIACDGTEDKKHIDLSSEPLVFVCAAGLPEHTIEDTVKEVAIFDAHKAAAVVVADEDVRHRFEVAHVIAVPRVEPEIAFVLSAMVGHLFGYEAALAIDRHARPLREAKSAIEGLLEESWTSGEAMLRGLRPLLEKPSAQFFSWLRCGAYDGNLDASTAARVASLLHYATATLPVEAYELENDRVGTPEAIVADLADALTEAIDELTRPIDAIKHQAKTVTVGVSRSEEELLGVPLVAGALAAGASIESVSYRRLRTLAHLDQAVIEVEGFTRYRIDGDEESGATIAIVARGGIALGLPSRTESDKRLLGAKHQAALDREVTVAVGARDGRSLILVPETDGRRTCGMTLLHVSFRESLPSGDARRVLEGYRGRYAALVDAVTETDTAFSDEQLEQIPLLDLLTLPLGDLAEQCRRAGRPLVH